MSMFSNILTTSSSCPCSGFWSPPSTPWFLRRFSAGFQRFRPWPTDPPSFALIAGRLLTLLRLGVAPVSLSSATLRPQALSTAASFWNSRISVLEHCPGSGGRCPGAALALPWRCPELFECWFYQNSTWIFRCSQKLCTETFYCAVQNDCEFD